MEAIIILLQQFFKGGAELPGFLCANDKSDRSKINMQTLLLFVGGVLESSLLQYGVTVGL